MTAVFLLNNSRFHHTSHSDEPLSYHVDVSVGERVDQRKSRQVVCFGGDGLGGEGKEGEWSGRTQRGMDVATLMMEHHHLTRGRRE